MGAFLPSHYSWHVQWCMKYSLAKLCHVTWYELSNSPKGRKEGGFSAKSLLMRCSMMHEIQFGKVTSCHTIWAEYLTKRQKRGGVSADLNQPEVLLSDQHRSFVYMKDQKSQVVHQKINLYMGKWASINTLSDPKSEMDTIIFKYNRVNLGLYLPKKLKACSLFISMGDIFNMRNKKYLVCPRPHVFNRTCSSKSGVIE